MSNATCKICGEWLCYPQRFCSGCGRALPTCAELGIRSYHELDKLRSEQGSGLGGPLI